MHELLRSVDLKLSRAKAQIESLDAAISTWINSNPLSVRCELREARLGFKLILQYSAEPPFEDWGLTVGECVHNVRSALDNLVYSLAKLHCDPPTQPRKLFFPIIQSNRTDFLSHSRGVLDQLPGAAAALLEAIQPFQRDGSPEKGDPNQDALVALQLINNEDKHRVPPLVLVAPQNLEHAPEIEFYSEEDAAANMPPDATVWAGPLSHEVTLLEYKTKHPVARVRGRYEVKAVVAFTLEAGDPVPVGPHLRLIRNYAALVVDQFRQFFV